MSLLTLSSSLKYIKGIGPVRTQVLSEMNIQTVGDLLYYFPRRHLDRTTVNDGTGQLSLVWFHGIPIIKKMIQEGDRLAVTGKIGFYKGFQIIHPEWVMLD